MKKIICLYLLGIMLLTENKVWLGVMDLAIDNEGRRITQDEMESIEDVNVKFRLGEWLDSLKDILGR